MTSFGSRFAAILACSATVAALAACTRPTAPKSAGIDKVNHVVVIYLENHSFDNEYGEFDGAEGLSSPSARAAHPQMSAAGTVYAALPMKNGSPFPTTLPNGPFDIDQYVPATAIPPDLVHRFYQEQMQIDGGKMDMFAAVSDAQGQVMGHYHTAGLPLAAEAAKYVLCDHFFHSAFGGSFLNHMYFITAAMPVFPDAPAKIVAKLDSAGHMVTDGGVTPDGYAINTLYTVNTPHPAKTPPANLMPEQTLPTIGDRLSAANVSWVWYSGGWNDAVRGKPDSLFQFHHQPFAYFAPYADSTPGRAAHLRDETEFIAAATAGTLPAVSFIKPVGADNEHPGYADIISGENHTLELINAVRNGPNWKDAVIIVTYDENGGQWDHVAPPKIDRWGPGSRIPAIIISPFAKRGYVDTTSYETVSILSFIESRWKLAPLTARDAKAAPLGNAFDFSRNP